MYSEITTLTTITLASEDIFPPKPWHDIPEEWKKVFKPLNDASGFVGGSLGRGVEHTHKGMIIAGWRSSADLADFTSSAEGQSYKDELAGMSQTAPIQHSLMSSRAELHTIDFPKDCQQAVGDRLRKVEGMAYVGRTGNLNGAKPDVVAKRDYYGSPHGDWVITQPDSEHDVEQAVWIHTWKSAERERHFKEDEPRTMSGLDADVVRDRGGEEHIFSVEEDFEERLRSIGAINITKEYYEFKRFPAL